MLNQKGNLHLRVVRSSQYEEFAEQSEQGVDEHGQAQDAYVFCLHESFLLKLTLQKGDSRELESDAALLKMRKVKQKKVTKPPKTLLRKLDRLMKAPMAM